MLENMVTFVRVIDLQGFRKAAKDLGISTPVVTKRINDLEANLATKLIQRSTRKLSITEAGSIFYAHCKEITQAVDTAKLAMSSMKHEISGTIKIGIPNSMNQLYLIPALPKLLKKYPSINIEISQGNHLLTMLDKGFDVVLHCGELPDSAYHYKKLGEWEKITCASPAYLKKHGTPVSIHQLASHNCLDHVDNRSHSWRYQEAEKTCLQSISGNIRANSSVDLKLLALSGLGIVYLPSFTVWEELKNKSLVRILKKFEPKPLGMYIVYPSKQFMSKKTGIIIEFIEKILAPFFKN